METRDTYLVSKGEDLGTIAEKFGLTSWKYLYKINRDVIGDNPDLLSEGMVIEIPQFDTSLGERLLKEKGVNPARYLGGLSYKYPWIPFSLTIVNSDGTVYRETDGKTENDGDFKEKKKYTIKDSESGNILVSGEITGSDEIKMLIPGAGEVIFELEDYGYVTRKVPGAGFCGTIKINEFKPLPRQVVSCIIDSHMHIQSSACTPLPLLYKQNFAKFIKRRGRINRLGWIFMSDGGRLAWKDTRKIGDSVIDDNLDTYEQLKNSYDLGLDKKRLEKFSEKQYKDEENVITPMFVMPMDMEYAHIAGYEGQRIYHEENEEVFYYKRKNAYHSEKEGEKVDLSHEMDKKKKALKLKKWCKQFNDHKESALKHPFHLIPLYHYEPRRWQMDRTETNTLDYGHWSYPFKRVVTEKSPGLFAGFKMYNPLGYKPLDPKLPHLWKYSSPDKTDCFYGRCEKDEIPVLAHCSPGGMPSHEYEFYAELEGFDPKIYVKEAIPKAEKERLQDIERYFYNKYVHPQNWRRVLEMFPKLKLCLAHFGGDEWEIDYRQSRWIQEIIKLTKEYENVYTDISCWDIEKSMPDFLDALKRYPHLEDKVVFGTDWYMTIVDLFGIGGTPYGEYCTEMKKGLDTADTSLWIKLSFLNPVRFYGLDNVLKINNLYDTLKDNKTKNETLVKNYSLLKKAIEKIEAIKDSI